MGSWIGYHLTVGPGDRDPAAVAADLRSGLREDVPELCNDPLDPPVRTEDGLVHASPGAPNAIDEYPEADHVRALSVPCEWALFVVRHELGDGTGYLFTWRDGRFVLADRNAGGHRATDVLDYFRRRWGVEGGRVR